MKKQIKIDYGIDAPELVRSFLVGGLSCFAIIAILYLSFGQSVWWLSGLMAILLVAALYFGFMGGLMVFYSKITKLSDRDAILAQVQWHGDEQVLDVGCGRGLMLIGAAKKLTTGKATGVDIWAAKDQSTNAAQNTLINALLEGVEDRLEVKTADMRKLPFEDGAFDVVVSNWAVHNLDDADDRKLALAEMQRVLKPNGTLLLSDIVNRGEYVNQLSEYKNLRMIVNPLKDRFLRVLSFGSFGPILIVAIKPI